jgi:L-ascorbate metabolism protein UlaG (beta-lactamase superfamily)
MTLAAITVADVGALDNLARVHVLAAVDDAGAKRRQVDVEACAVERDNRALDDVADREPFAIVGPGEYEVVGYQYADLRRQSSYNASQAETRINTIYSITLEGMNLCFLGALSDPTLPPAAKQELDDIDVLFVPIGGEGVLDHAAAYKLAVQLEPKAIVPMHYGKEMEGQIRQRFQVFLKEAGSEGAAG